MLKFAEEVTYPKQYVTDVSIWGHRKLGRLVADIFFLGFMILSQMQHKVSLYFVVFAHIYVQWVVCV